MNIYQNSANHVENENDGHFSQRRLWTAVLLQAIEDWRSTNMRRNTTVHQVPTFQFQQAA